MISTSHLFSSRKPLFWILLTFISISCTVFSIKYFSRAFPIANIDLKIDRLQALTAAKELASSNHWGPENFTQAISFEADHEVQNYVELEAGGASAFNELIKGELYSPYAWHVRHFHEGETNETSIFFKPDGTPYGFVEKIAETIPGAKLLESPAREIAEEKARNQWNVNFNDFALIEASQEVKPSGRIDHTFVYERPTQQIGEARYRLRLVVSGDTLTELRYFMKLPEAFFVRYKEMRSANITISSIARFAVNILYILLGCCLGLFLLMRKRYVLWHYSLLWAACIAFLNIAASINQLPLLWMYYDTAVSASNFLIQQLILIFTSSASLFVYIFLAFTAAESLTRKAFGYQLQLWKLWSPQVASSIPLVGRTIGGYLIVGFDLAFVVGTYLLTRHYFGWWTPSDLLIDPNILATYLPWLTPATMALQAGFLEECLFRAVPLAGAALIGQYFGRRNQFLVVGFVLQAIIFGAAHAFYPTQPAYGRLLELIIPSFVFGGIYLVYGLLPGIISHFIFDLLLMALPLMLSTAHRAWIDKLMVIVIGAAPLLIIAYAYWRIKQLRNKVSTENYNSHWQPSHESTHIPELQPLPELKLNGAVTKVALITGLAGAALWALTTQFTSDALPISIKRPEGIQIAENNYQIDALRGFTPLAFVNDTTGISHAFVWQKGGKKIYHQLLTNLYLTPPHWSVRFARFTGSADDRSESYRVSIAEHGTVINTQHVIPESREGVALEQKQAKAIALQAIEKEFKVNPQSLITIAETPKKLPHRTDWEFIFSNPDYPLHEGQARISVDISGDQVTEVNRYIHVPEEWTRNYRNERSLLQTIQYLAMFLLAILIALAILYILFTAQFAWHDVIFIFSGLLLIELIRGLSSWPIIIAHFNAAEPWNNQVLRVIGGTILFALLSNGGIALAFSYVRYVLVHRKTSLTFTDGTKYKLIAFALGTIIMGVLSAVYKFGPSLEPQWPSYAAAGCMWPIISTALSLWSLFIGLTVILILANIFMNGWTNYGRKHHTLTALMFIFLGYSLVTFVGQQAFSIFALQGVALGILLLIGYRYLFRFEPALVVFTANICIVLMAFQQMAMRAYPTAALGNILGVLLIGYTTKWLYDLLQGNARLGW